MLTKKDVENNIIQLTNRIKEFNCFDSVDYNFVFNTHVNIITKLKPNTKLTNYVKQHIENSISNTEHYIKVHYDLDFTINWIY